MRIYYLSTRLGYHTYKKLDLTAVSLLSIESLALESFTIDDWIDLERKPDALYTFKIEADSREKAWIILMDLEEKADHGELI